MNDKEQKILRFLKKKPHSSSSKIASIIKSDKWMAQKYLEALELAGKIKKTEETVGTYWDLI